MLVFVLFLARALTSAVNHDESQYVAAAVLASGRLIFRDYLSLQPPLHAWLFAPLAMVWPHHIFVAMRVATAVLGTATVALVYCAGRQLGGRRAAGIAALLFACCDTVQFTAGIVRNDMLPAAFAAAGLLSALRALKGDAAGGWLLAGAAFGLAASTKLSYTPFCAVGLAWLLLSGPDRRGGIGFAAGLALGLLPMLLCLAIAPRSFVYGVFVFASTGPFHYYSEAGVAAELGLAQKAYDLLRAAARGPALPAVLLVVAGGIAFARARRLDRAMRFMLAMLLAGLLGAAIPTPTHRQYLLPLLAPLFVALVPVLAPGGSVLGRRWIGALLAMFAIGGLIGTAQHVARTTRPAALATGQQARWIGARLRAAGARGAIATFSPERTIDAGFAIDPLFATGPCVFRSGRLLTPAAAMRMNVAIPVTLAAMLDRAPPAAILTGYEGRRRGRAIPPDAYLDRYAALRGYRLVSLPDGEGRLLIRPR